MYMYAPGAGSSGEAMFVAPGDELIFSISMQWQECEAPLLSEAAEGREWSCINQPCH